MLKDRQEWIACSGWQCRLLLRIPVIPGFNETRASTAISVPVPRSKSARSFLGLIDAWSP
jgi:hypothetical protein